MSNLVEKVQQHHAQSSQVDEGVGRYSAYLMRLRTLFLASTRYIAYTSDIGEAFRPLMNPAVVTAAYGISWAYIVGDVGYTCYNAGKGRDFSDASVKKDIGWIGARRAVFQTLARYVAVLTQSGVAYV